MVAVPQFQENNVVISLISFTQSPFLLACLLCSTAVRLPLLAAPLDQPAESAPNFITSPTDSVLLLGEHTVAKTTNLTQHFFPAGKHPANPVMEQTEAWEGVGPYVWGNRLIQDEKTGEFRLWYIAYDYVGNFYRWGYATSPDGIAWTKPNLGVEQYNGAPATNLLPLGEHPEKSTATATDYSSTPSRKAAHLPSKCWTSTANR